MCCLLLAVAVLIAAVLLPTVADAPATAWLVGVLAIPGVFVSAITGMLYKIVPFISWLHLQRLAPLGTPVPNVNELLPGIDMQRQLWLHALAIALLLATALAPELARPAGAVFALASAWLAANLFRAARRFAVARDRIGAAAPDPAR
jgi:hypothetical protein